MIHLLSDSFDTYTVLGVYSLYEDLSIVFTSTHFQEVYVHTELGHQFQESNIIVTILGIVVTRLLWAVCRLDIQ